MRPGQNGAVGMVLPVMTFASWLFACLLVLHIIRGLGLFAYDVVEVFFFCMYLVLILVSKLVAVAWRGLAVFTATCSTTLNSVLQ